MKNLFFLCVLVFFTGKATAQGYLNITGLNISQINANTIKVNLKIYSPVYTTYNSYTSTISENVVTLKVCYIVTFGQLVSNLENDFEINIPETNGNYTLKVEVSPRSSGVCFQSPHVEDSATIDFTTPFDGVIFLSSSDITQTDKNVTLYPNPAKDLLHFSEEVSAVKITDLSGKDVRQYNVSGKSVDVSQLPTGIYLISISTKEGKLLRKKMIKE